MSDGSLTPEILEEAVKVLMSEEAYTPRYNTLAAIGQAIGMDSFTKFMEVTREGKVINWDPIRGCTCVYCTGLISIDQDPIPETEVELFEGEITFEI